MTKLNKRAKLANGAPQDKRLAAKLIVKFKNGSTMRGTTYDLNPARKGFHFIGYPASKGNKDRYINFSDLKYVAIVESFVGKKRTSRPEYQPHGSEVTIVFKDGEKLDGYTLKQYNDKDPRFPVIPMDPQDNRISIFVQRDAIADMRLGRIPKAQELRKLVDSSTSRLLLHYYWQHPDIVITVDQLAARIERTSPAVERELEKFINEGLVKRVGKPADKQLKFMPPQDPVIRQVVSSMGREIDLLYFRKRPAKSKPARSGGRIGPASNPSRHRI